MIYYRVAGDAGSVPVQNSPAFQGLNFALKQNGGLYRWIETFSDLKIRIKEATSEFIK
jgi:hypothetical protein